MANFDETAGMAPPTNSDPIPFKTEGEASSTPSFTQPSGGGISGESQSPVPEPRADLNEKAKTFVGKDGGFLGKIKSLFLILFIILVLTGVGGVVYKFVLPQVNLPFALPFAQKTGVTLNYWGLWEEDNITAQAIADYQKDHPNVKISYQRQSPQDYRERLQSALARGEGPDIFRFHNTWVPMLKNELSPIPAKVMDAATFEATYYPVARNDLRIGSSYVGIPLEIDGLALYINDDLFKAAGKQPPKTWDELRKTALELTVKDSQGETQIAGVALGRTENVDHWSDILGLMMLQNGADPAKPTGKLAEDALTYFTIFSRVDNVWDQSLPPSTVAFSGGKLAMYFGPSWEAFEIKRANPNLVFQIVPVPQLPDTNITWASYWAEGVSKKSKYQAEAWDFTKYLSSKETMQKLYQTASNVRLFGEPYSRVDMAGIIENEPFVGAYIKEAPVARSWYLASKTYDNGLNEKIIKYFEDAVNAVNQGKDAKNALEAASQGVPQILAQYGLASAVVR
ncbi:MAG: extracellular solute-binding protein [bacterium]|nr:extracellular solute-binding protein [bacterium]